MESSKLKKSVLSGALSGCLTAIIFQPFEFVKTKLQQPSNSELKASNKSITEILKRTLTQKIIQGDKEIERIKLSNLTKFWTGLSPSLIRSAPVAGIYFGCIETFKNYEPLKNSKLNTDFKILHSFLIGSSSKVIADTSTYPLGLIKTRFESDLYKYGGIRNAFSSIIKNEGVLSLYKGLYATLARDVSYSGVYFTLYTSIKSNVKYYLDQRSESRDLKLNETSVYFASCALLSGIISSAVTQPPDVIRSYMQLKPDQYPTFTKTMRKIYSIQGFNGFFVGFLPRTIRRSLISVLSWTVYEKFTLN